MGLPCAHFLRQKDTTGQAVLLDHVHRHWFFNPLQAPVYRDLILDPQLLNPLPTRTKGRPRDSVSSTRRHLSQFEMVMKKRQLRGPRQQQSATFTIWIYTAARRDIPTSGAT